MARYIALLRGVNVGGISIKMAPLRAAVAQLGHGDVRTVLASGNVAFSSDRTDVDALKAELEAMLRATFGYDAWIVLTDTAALERVVAGYPFEEEYDERQPYALFGSDPASLAELAGLGSSLDPAVEQIAPGEGVLYWEVQRGQTINSTFGKAASRAQYKSTTTNRNLRPLRKLLAA